MQQDYAIHFRSGDYFPPHNLREVIREPKLLSPAIFNNNYYIIIQFESLPDSMLIKRLTANGVRLLQYLPQLAYTAAIPANKKLDFLQNTRIRALFVPAVKHKMTKELHERKFPKWAVPQKNYVDVVVSTFEQFDLAMLQDELKTVEANAITTETEFTTLTLRLPQRNLFTLASLPFVASMESVPEPPKAEQPSTIKEN